MTVKMCTVKNCVRFIEYNGGRGLCHAHYKRFMDHGDVREDIPLKTQSMKPMIICANHLCQKIIYDYQPRFNTLYCSKDCLEDKQHWKFVTTDMEKVENEERVVPEN